MKKWIVKTEALANFKNDDIVYQTKGPKKDQIVCVKAVPKGTASTYFEAKLIDQMPEWFEEFIEPAYIENITLYASLCHNNRIILLDEKPRIEDGIFYPSDGWEIRVRHNYPVDKIIKFKLQIIGNEIK